MASGIDVDRLLPSGRSLLTAFALVVVAVAGYLVARNTSAFAVTTIDVEGAPPAVALQVRRALRADRGTSLLRVDMDELQRRVAAVPTVASASLDRAFPHTLRIAVVPERAVAVVRQGASSWLVSSQGRVMASLDRGARRQLPRIWIAKGPVLRAGGTAPAALGDALAAVSPLGSLRFPARVASVRETNDELTLALRSGIEVRLGAATSVRLKLAVAAKVLPLVGADTLYVDVSVPERPVAGTVDNPEPASRSSASSSAADPSTPDTTLNSQVEVDGAGVITP